MRNFLCSPLSARRLIERDNIIIRGACAFVCVCVCVRASVWMSPRLLVSVCTEFDTGR